VAPYLHVSVVLELFSLFYLFSSKMLCKLDFLPCCHFFFANFKFKSCFVKALMLFFYVIIFYHAGTFCARLRARLLVCFDRHVGWKQPVKLHLIKLMRQMMAVTLN